MERYIEACNYGVLDEDAVNAALVAYCAAPDPYRPGDSHFLLI
jgi:hypothetical protein